MEFPINTGSIYKKKKCILIDWLAVFLVLALQGKQQLWLSRLPHSLGGDTANGEVPLCLSVAVHLKALLSLWKWKLLMYVTDNGPGGEIGNGSSLMARTEGMNRAGIIERPWVACQVILRGWLDECVAARRRGGERLEYRTEGCVRNGARETTVWLWRPSLSCARYQRRCKSVRATTHSDVCVRVGVYFADMTRACACCVVLLVSYGLNGSLLYPIHSDTCHLGSPPSSRTHPVWFMVYVFMIYAADATATVSF